MHDTHSPGKGKMIKINGLALFWMRWQFSCGRRLSFGALMMRTWFPLTPRLATVTRRHYHQGSDESELHLSLTRLSTTVRKEMAGGSAEQERDFSPSIDQSCLNGKFLQRFRSDKRRGAAAPFVASAITPCRRRVELNAVR